MSDPLASSVSLTKKKGLVTLVFAIKLFDRTVLDAVITGAQIY